ncbi:MAG: response regulator, partial [Planctomycetota bacterium]
MDKRDSDFKKRLLATFRIEAEEHLNSLSSGLLELEKLPSSERKEQIVETIFRTTHSLKGASRAVGEMEAEIVCQSMEEIFSLWKKEGIKQSPGLFDVFYRAIDILRALILTADHSQSSTVKGDIQKLVKELSRQENVDTKGRAQKNARASDAAQQAAPQKEKKEQEGKKDSGTPMEKERAPLPETVRISAGKLWSLLFQAEEMLTARQMVGQCLLNFKDVAGMLEILKKESSDIHQELSETGNGKKRNGAGDKGLTGTSQSARLQDYLAWESDHIRSIESRLQGFLKTTGAYHQLFDRMVDDLLVNAKAVTLFPFSVLLEGLPLLVRNIAHEQGKEVELVIRGEGIEIDKRILDELKDPFIHLIRNCVGHGIEKPVTREHLKKSIRGVITINVLPVAGNKVEVVISDDGAGIDLKAVKSVAVRSGVLSQAEAEALGEEEVTSLVFHSGISTSSRVDNISGRGLGLAIVREKIERLGGSISVKTVPAAGTAFRVIVPLTAAMLGGIVVQVSNQAIVVPTMNVDRTLRIKVAEIVTVENKDAVLVNSIPVSFVWLYSILELPQPKEARNSSSFLTVLVVTAGGKRIALGVDTVLGEEKVLTKGLGKQLFRVRNIAGVAILGSGLSVPVLNVSDVARSLMKTSMSLLSPAAVEEVKGAVQSVLVVEDSITSRVLLKSILESAGYRVKTAIDGIDALTMLKVGDFDLIISDVDMPRMDGYELTAKVRSDKKFADMPIVLVTSLATRENRERGIDVGANAYIVKSSFNQSDLLDTVRRLI